MAFSEEKFPTFLRYIHLLFWKWLRFYLNLKEIAAAAGYVMALAPYQNDDGAWWLEDMTQTQNTEMEATRFPESYHTKCSFF